MILALVVAVPVALHEVTGDWFWEGNRQEVELMVQFFPQHRSIPVKISVFKNQAPLPFINDEADSDSPWELKIAALPTDVFRLRATQLTGGVLIVSIVRYDGQTSVHRIEKPGTAEVVR